MKTCSRPEYSVFERARFLLAFPLFIFLFVGIPSCSEPKTDVRDNEAASRVDNFECTRDPDVLLGLLANSQTCVTTDECPMGSHCDTVQHVCTWNCISDSDCGSTGACDCAGLCTTSGGGSGVDGGVASDPTCPRDQAVLLGMNTPAAACSDLMPCPAGQTCNPVTNMCDAPTCRHDDQCPAGSHCDATGRCSFTCLPGATTGSPEACNAGEVCNCGGECVPAGSVPLVDTADAASMSVSVDRIAVGAGDPFPEQTFTLRLKALRAEQFTDAAQAPVVTVVASDGIDVAVGADPGAPEIQISSWTPIAVDGRYVATVEIRVIGTAGAPLPGHIELRGERTSPRYRRLAVDRDFSTPRELWDALDGHYQDSSAGLDAWIRNGHVYLSESNPGAATNRAVAFALRNNATPSFPPTDQPGDWLEIDDALPPADPIPMIVHRGDGTSESLSFSRVGDITIADCTTDADCGVDAYCERGIEACVTGEDFRLPDAPSPLEGYAPGLDTLPVLGEDSEAYVTPVQDRAERLFCYDPAQGSGQPYGGTGLDRTPTTGVLTAGGDLRCLTGRTPRMFRLITEAEERADAANTPEVLAPTCVDGFVPQGTGGYFNLLTDYSDPEQAADWFVHSESDACIAPERALGALALLVAEDYRAISSARLLNHVITRLADTLSFTAMQGAQLTLADRTLELVPTLSANSTARLVDALHLVLDESAGLDSTIAPEALREPDYRIDRPLAFWSFDLPDGEVSPGNGTGVPPIVYDLVGDRDLVFGTDVVAQEDDYGVYFSLPGSPGTPEVTLSQEVRDIPLPGDFTIAFSARRPRAGGITQIYSLGQFVILLQNKTSTSDPDDSLLTIRWETSTGLQSVSYTRLLHTSSVHFALVRSGGHLHFYDNGDLVGVDFLGLPVQPAGYSGIQLELADQLNNLTIWDRALDSALITKHYNSTRVYDNTSLNLAGFPVAATDRQATGYPVAMVEAASQVVRLAELGLSHATLRNFATCSPSIVSDEMRTAESAIFVARRTLAAMRKHVDRASLTLAVQGLECPSGSTPGTYDGTEVCMSGGAPLRTTIPWQSFYDRAVTELESALRSAQDTWGRARLCENPLGIPNGWVPTYFGDVTGESSKFLASSDYLMERWALPHAAAARASFASAQSAYVQQRQSEIQQTLSDQDANRRVEAIELRYGEELKQLCGIESMDATDVLDGFAPGGQLLIENCGLAESCQNADPLTGSCFVGDVGRAMQGIRHVQAESIRVSIRAVDRWIEAWAQQTYCSEQEALLGTQTTALEELIDFREQYRDLYEDDADTGGFLGGLIDGVADVRRVVTSMVRLDFEGASNAVNDFNGADDVREQIREMEDAYTVLQQQTSNYLQNRSCWLEFDRMFRAASDAVRAVSSLKDEEATRELELHNLIRRVGNAIDDGLTARDRELGRGQVEVAFHYWLDEHLDKYHSDLALAKKYAYLAMRAAEHELQQSFGLDGQILGATTPSRLENALAIVDQYRFTRGINGRRPSEDIIVMSMRDQLQKLEASPAALIYKGYRAITAEERFGKRLMSPQFALYDRNGRYLGQALRFVVPAEYELTHRCAERLWRVTATVQGDGLDIGAPTIPMVMLKSSSFASQWCEDHGTGDDDGFQNAWSGPLVALGHAESSDSNDFTPASISAWLNVRRSELYRDQYTEGASEELAGRGLYGEYVLLFPQAGLFDRPGKPLPLEMVEDVLVRFDYVSISDLQPQLLSQDGHEPASRSLQQLD